MPEGLSDALRQLADGEHSQAGERRSTPAPSPAVGRLRKSSTDAAYVDPEEANETGEAASDHGGAAESTDDASKVRRTVKLMAAGVLLIVGLAMAALALWSTAVLIGWEVWRSDQPGARRVATMMLVAYPIALGLLGMSGFLLKRGSRA